MTVSLLEDLIEALRCLPGVGPKSAQRMALHLLERDRPGAMRLADRLSAAMGGVVHCQQCRNFCESEFCSICADSARSPEQLCVVENPSDVLALERATEFSGRYFVLMGHLSPLDGIGPEDIGLNLLEELLAKGEIKELILATGSTVEGETTAHYIGLQAKNHGVKVVKLAQGVPLGGELDYIDSGTLSLAFSARSAVGL